jgi:flagellin
MSLRINQNIAAMNTYRNLSVNDGQMAKSLEKLSSGFRINRAADDAAGLVTSESLRAQTGGLKVAVRNAQDGISVVQTAEGALNEVHSMLQRMRDLAVQAANGSQDATALSAADSEFSALSSEIDRISTSTKFGSTNLLDGTFSAKDFQVGANTGDTISVTIAKTDATTLGVGSLNLTTGAAAAIDTVNAAINTVSTTRAGLGADQNRFEHTIANLNVSVENISASESRIRDVDMAQEMVSYTRNQIMTQAGTAMLAQANSAPQGVLQLLRG